MRERERERGGRHACTHACVPARTCAHTHIHTHTHTRAEKGSPLGNHNEAEVWLREVMVGGRILLPLLTGECYKPAETETTHCRCQFSVTLIVLRYKIELK